jgi:hypothetical protein
MTILAASENHRIRAAATVFRTKSPLCFAAAGYFIALLKEFFVGWALAKAVSGNGTISVVGQFLPDMKIIP